MSWDAEHYKLGNTLQEKLALETVANHLGDVIVGKEILDMGCGTGNITSKLATVFAAKRVHGIDLSRSMIDYCNRTYSNPQVTFSQNNIRDLTIQEEYDIVTSFFCLHWLDTASKIQTFAAASRALRPQGILLTMGGIRGEQQLKHPLVDAIRDLLPELQQQYPQLQGRTVASLTGYHRFTEAEATTVLTTSGLTIEHLEHCDIPLHFADVETLKNFIRPLITPSILFTMIPASKTRELFDTISDRVYNNLDNGVYMFYTTIVKAIKN